MVKLNVEEALVPCAESSLEVEDDVDVRSSVSMLLSCNSTSQKLKFVLEPSKDSTGVEFAPRVGDDEGFCIYAKWHAVEAVRTGFNITPSHWLAATL